MIRYLLFLALPAVLHAQNNVQLAPQLTEFWTPPLATVDTTGARPADAIVLFDGSSLDGWVSAKDGAPCPWDITADGAMQVIPKSGNVRSLAKFGDVQLHLEFRTPAVISGKGQGRGNSGIFFMERYELQILDGHDNPTYINGGVGSVYKQHVPLVNAARPPGTWQTYDVVFIAPRFAPDGTLISPARLTAFLNGVLVQHDVSLLGPTVFRGRPAYAAHEASLPIVLQDHNNLTAFRNIWARPLDLPAGPWENLFVGELDQWETWLGRPHQSMTVPGLPRDAEGKYLAEVGLNTDPLNVFSIVEEDGEPAIRISGQIFGALTTKRDYTDYHFTLEYKWGDEKWAPRANAPLDSGILYHAVGPHGVQNHAWMLSQEMQIWEGQVGDYYSVGGGIVDIRASRPIADQPWVYDLSATARQFGPWSPRYNRENPNPFPTRCNRLGNLAHDQREGWNRLDLYVLGGTSVHVVNGTVVMVLENSRRPLPDGSIEPLTRGRIQLQSEGAEIFYRDIRLQPITRFPAGLLP